MFERYTEKARRVLFWALNEARQMASPAIETEHLLLGVAREDAELLRSAVGPDWTEEWLRQRIQAGAGVDDFTRGGPNPPLSKECKRVLAYAGEEAEGLGHRHIGTEHLLLGLMREEGCTATRLLKLQGADLKQVRKQVGKRPVPPINVGGEVSFSPAAWAERQRGPERLGATVAGQAGTFGHYSEHARRAIFFARWEASEFGTKEIENEHLLLGLWRAGPVEMKEWTGITESYDELLARVEKRKPRGQAISASVDMPVSEETKRALAYGEEEGERMGGGGVGCGHLLLGLLREEGCFAAELLRERGANLEGIRKKVEDTYR